MRALYDLSRYLTSFNFFEWLVQAEANGATCVVFDIRRIRDDKWPAPIAEKRFWSICHPGPAMIRLPCEVVDGKVGTVAGARDFGAPGGARLVSFCRSGRDFKRLCTVRRPIECRYTVTLRNTQRSAARNSDRRTWEAFAGEIGAIVIPDYEERSIHLHDRMALYAGAQMNFFVSNGPGILCSLSEYPCMMFNTGDASGSLLADGMRIGEQYPWMLPNQRAIWEFAEPRTIRRHFHHWLETGTFLPDDEDEIAALRRRHGVE